MHTSFMKQDVLHILAAVPLFLPYLFCSGYAIAFACNILSFRRQSTRTRVAISIVVSYAVAPITINLAARWLSISHATFLFLTLGLLSTAACLIYEKRHAVVRFAPDTTTAPISKVILIGTAGAWVLLCLGSFPDLQIGHRLWTSVLIYDGGLRASFIDAVLRTGVPPANPLFFAGAASPARYYYYWSTLCALPALLGHLPARAVLAASSVWTGFALAALASLYCQYFLDVHRRLQKTTLLAVGLLAITGLDLIPTVISWFAQGFVRADMEWWDGTEIPSWIDSILWTPHHIAGLICCLTAFLLLWPAAAPHGEHPAKKVPRAHIAIAALAFASSVGLSAYVAFCFALFMFAWTIRSVVRRGLAVSSPFGVAGVAAFVLSLPFLHDLQAPAAQQRDAHTGRTAHLITTGLRTSGWVKRTFPHAHFWRTPLLISDLAVTYVLEFGLFFVIFLLVARHLWHRRKSLSEANAALLYLFATSLIVTTFLKSEAIRSNDLGMRAPLLAQWALLLWALPWIQRLGLLRRLSRRAAATSLLLYACIALGTVATAYQLVLLRFAAPLDEIAGGRSVPPIKALPISTPGDQAYAIRAATTSLAPLLHPADVVAYNPFNPDRLLLLANIPAQLSAATPVDCGTAFGGSPVKCTQLKSVLASLFGVDRQPVSLPQLVSACFAEGINVLVVQSTDPVWAQANSWVWQLPALVSNSSLRAVRCSVH